MPILDPTDRAWTAPELERLALGWLAAHFPNAILVREFVCGAGGSSRIDLAAICENEIVGVELKADTDGPERLPLQGFGFGQVCSRVWLLASPRTEPRVKRQRPGQWGSLCVLALGGGSAGLREQYTAKASDRESPRWLLDLLWREEIGRFAQTLAIPTTRRTHGDIAADIVADIVAKLPMPDIRIGVCALLRRRRWQRIGAQECSRVILPEDLAQPQ